MRPRPAPRSAALWPLVAALAACSGSSPGTPAASETPGETPGETSTPTATSTAPGGATSPPELTPTGPRTPTVTPAAPTAPPTPTAAPPTPTASSAPPTGTPAPPTPTAAPPTPTAAPPTPSPTPERCAEDCAWGGATCDRDAGACVCPTGGTWSGARCVYEPCSDGQACGALSIAAGYSGVEGPEVTLYVLPPGNLLRNGGAETGSTEPWVEGGDPSGWLLTCPALFGLQCFISTWYPLSLTQRLDLTALGYTAAELDVSAPTLVVRAWVGGREPNVSDPYSVTLAMTDDRGYATGSPTVLTGTGTSAWTERTLDVPLPIGTRRITLQLAGQDVEVYSGNHGAMFDGAYVGFGPWEMRLSNDGETWTAWSPWSSRVPWTLDATPGTHTVYGQLRRGDEVWEVEDSISLLAQ